MSMEEDRPVCEVVTERKCQPIKNQGTQTQCNLLTYCTF